jgi:UDP-N-acetylglucosamine 1-carboxyvinyltransferase
MAGCLFFIFRTSKNMDAFRIEGGTPLKGTIIPQGAKNEALQIICATLLTEEKVTIHNIPDISDVNMLISLLEDFGVKVKKLGEGSFSFHAKNVNLDFLYSKDYAKKTAKLRCTIMILGPLLARFKKAYIPKPGGDKIGRRRLDTHFLGFEKLGAKFNFDAKENTFTVDARELKGTYILLYEASVTGTANVIMAATLAKGTTTIFNAACEPYIQQLCKMLISMGAKIDGVGSNLLHVKGVQGLRGCEHTCLSDMIEVGSFIGLAAMTQSELLIKNAQP